MEASEIEQILHAARVAESMGSKGIGHLTGRLNVLNYVRFADIVRRVLGQGKILDRGCGYGQMTHLLRNRGLEVESFDIVARPNIDKLPIFGEIAIRYAGNPRTLPYKNAEFDAVLSCGTLEHVEDVSASMSEIWRVLRRRGKFFIFMLPGKFSYIEWLNDLRGKSDHPVRYTRSSATSLLEDNGFEVLSFRRRNMLPRNCLGLPRVLAGIYREAWPVLDPLDRFLSRMPGLNLTSGTLEFIAEKRDKD